MGSERHFGATARSDPIRRHRLTNFSRLHAELRVLRRWTALQAAKQWPLKMTNLPGLGMGLLLVECFRLSVLQPSPLVTGSICELGAVPFSVRPKF